MDCKPFVEILAFRELYRKAQISGTLLGVNTSDIGLNVGELTSVASAYFLS
jgi:hypothetical protein